MPSHGLLRREIYRKFLKAKGRYTFWYAMNSDLEEVFLDEKGAYKKIIDWIVEGKGVIFRCGFAWDAKRGDEVELYWRERLFGWNEEKNDFELLEEETHSEGLV